MPVLETRDVSITSAQGMTINRVIYMPDNLLTEQAQLDYLATHEAVWQAIADAYDAIYVDPAVAKVTLVHPDFGTLEVRELAPGVHHVASNLYLIDLGIVFKSSDAEVLEYAERYRAMNPSLPDPQ